MKAFRLDMSGVLPKMKLEGLASGRLEAWRGNAIGYTVESCRSRTKLGVLLAGVSAKLPK